MENSNLTPAEAIAKRYGEANWDRVSQLNFSFNVKSAGRELKRSFQWFPKTDDVVFTSDTDTIEYNRNATLDSLALYADKRFINDTYWLLAPYKLVWDEGVSISEEKNVIAPISGDTLHKLTILYDGEGGYTVWGKLCSAKHSVAINALPVGLAKGVRLIKDIPENGIVKLSDVELDETCKAFKLRQLMTGSLY